MFFWPRPHQMYRTTNEEGTKKASHAGYLPYPSCSRLRQALRGVPDGRESAETVEEQRGKGEPIRCSIGPDGNVARMVA
jgi:hypothetical protein